MIEAIVYTSNTGYTEEYARMLSKSTGLRALLLKDAVKALKRGTPVIYMGWLMAGVIKGYKKAAGYFDVKAVCCVGIMDMASQLGQIKQAAGIPEQFPIFPLKGGFDMNRLHGAYKLMMNIMRGSLIKQAETKAVKTRAEEEMIDLLKNGGSLVSAEQLDGIIKWCSAVISQEKS